MNTENRECEIIEWVRPVLQEWCQSPDPRVLLGWLNGIGLPPIGPDEPPYVWITRALPWDGERAAVERCLAHACSSLLQSFEDRNTGRIKSPQIDIHLLRLCESISCPDILHNLLYDIAHAPARFIEPAGEYRIDVLCALRDALTFNQIDASSAALWSELIEQRPCVLPGSVFDGVRGILYMPASSEERGFPSTDHLAAALTSWQRVLLDNVRRRIEWKYTLELVMGAYPNVDWAGLLIEMAHSNGWETWAVESLPTLCTPCKLDSNPKEDGTIVVYLWKYIAAIVAEAVELKTIEWLCDETIVKGRLPSDRLPLLQLASSHIERLRRLNPYKTDKSMIGVVMDALVQLRSELEISSSDHDVENESTPNSNGDYEKYLRAISRSVSPSRVVQLHDEMLQDSNLVIGA